MAADLPAYRFSSETTSQDSKSCPDAARSDECAVSSAFMGRSRGYGVEFEKLRLERRDRLTFVKFRTGGS
ncbi:hypothetical protein HS1genome_1466 [Sulfodiicoccus acidiphilus]|uniref:Uncharacterized protein n=1 Tax=Sulfodiicoccus acidiphilus TaxID=1670455 RepID=A0A348B4H5_9CREN|nr:hypothetical protein HS1genome_1466 [Sulfodiicoccus acidiphilus]